MWGRLPDPTVIGIDDPSEQHAVRHSREELMRRNNSR